MGTDHDFPRVSVGTQGDFLIAWESLTQDGSGVGIFARHYQADGLAAGDEFRVNATVAGNQQRPFTAYANEDTAVVVWSGNGIGDDQGIFQQSFAVLRDATGNGGGVANKGTLALTNATLSGNEAAVQGGGLHNAAGATTTAVNNTVAANSAAGVGGETLLKPVGTEFRANASIGSAQAYGVTAMDAAGNYVVVWESTHEGQRSIFGQRFSAAGVALGEFRISDHSVNERARPSVAMTPLGDFVVTWQGWAADADRWGIHARYYSANGTLQAGTFVVNDYQSGDQHSAAVAMNEDGGFVVAWQGPGIRARRFDKLCTPLSGDIQVNTTAGAVDYPRVATGRDDSFVITWQVDGHDGDSSGVYARRFAPDGSAVGLEFLCQYGDGRISGTSQRFHGRRWSFHNCVAGRSVGWQRRRSLRSAIQFGRRCPRQSVPRQHLHDE